MGEAASRANLLERDASPCAGPRVSSPHYEDIRQRPFGKVYIRDAMELLLRNAKQAPMPNRHLTAPEFFPVMFLAGAPRPCQHGTLP
jgi:hypothetical protein